ncbi:cell wall-binding repeat-containing protein [Peptacetobacter sp.]|uniref:cell wall-binding repeat-containing protein n=1 Tax=Peptacetobacter sp. TaxID=2991975 RepID=UPI0026196A36|nr:cell wall-binding repeat-containing protein [Peptacetobacter sp.]
MNKKKLSVVMAGTMLATTVVPVMAESTNSINTDMSSKDLGLLIRKVRETLESKKFTDDKRNGDLAGDSIYYIKIDGIESKEISSATKTGGMALQTALQNVLGNLKSGQVVQICSRGFITEGTGTNEKVYANTLKEKYDSSDMSDVLKTKITSGIQGNTNIIANPKTDITVDQNQSITIKLATNSGAGTSIVIKPGDKILDFTSYIDTNGNSAQITKTTPAKASDFCGFVNMPESGLTDYVDIADKVVEDIKIIGENNTYNTSDLYDGLMLTTKGHELLSLIESTSKDGLKANVSYKTLTGLNISTANYNLPQSTDKTYGFDVNITDKFGNVTTYTIKGSKKETQTLLNWLYNKDAKVDILAGEDRYETAVTVAKEYANKNTAFVNGTGNIVMVNGNSLVDGLSASPLAAKLNAPMLLTKTDTIPKATADYIKELAANAKIGDLKGITINLVGGNSVISKGLERELKSYGFTVKRFSGEDREATSLKVASAIGNTDSAFVVGANGEADAMSIASVASSSKISASGNAINPIIVSGVHGISENALDTLNGKDVTIVGGKSVVSDEDFNDIKDAVGKNGSAYRLAGENRKETNAKVINKYYKNAFGANSDVLVAKDGMHNKMGLVDALTVSNLAALNNSPIVLATDSLSNSQVNAIELNAKQADGLYQVGYGVSTNVVKTLASCLGLAK